MSAEDRRAQRRAAFVAAGLQLIGTDGFARLTVSGLCAQAGLNERYFYENFGGLEDVLGGVFDDVVTALTSTILETFLAAPDDARAKARAVIGAAIELVTDDPRLSKVLFTEGLTAPSLTARRAEIVRGFVALMIEQAAAFYGPAVRLRAGALADFAAAYMFGGLAESLLAWLRGDVAMTRDELIERSTDFFVLVGEHALN